MSNSVDVFWKDFPNVSRTEDYWGDEVYAFNNEDDFINAVRAFMEDNMVASAEDLAMYMFQNFHTDGSTRDQIDLIKGFYQVAFDDDETVDRFFELTGAYFRNNGGELDYFAILDEDI